MYTLGANGISPILQGGDFIPLSPKMQLQILKYWVKDEVEKCCFQHLRAAYAGVSHDKLPATQNL
jgi:hypothetical protein